MHTSPIVLITGASSGIGKASAELLFQKGYTVYGTSRKEMNSPVNGVHFLPLDVTDSASIKKVVEQLIEAEGRIDYLINNAGMGITGAVEEIPLTEAKRVFDTNYFGVLELTNEVLPHMRKQHSGMIIHITSIAGYMGLPFRGIYSASKASLEITAEAYRMELKPFNITMTCIAPGDVATNIANGRYHAPRNANSPYAETYGKTLAMMDAHVDTGMSPLKMAKAIAKVMKIKEPRPHYKVGEPLQKFSIVLKNVLPDTWYEKLLLNHHKL
ncbi:SDR family oxidoreductase [Gangjinia marincola]|uniref:SDR family oxidoreductase n=2 Tax=Gangjinia marincola TaxID=578463 RepID=A0ABN1MGT2_9FLAO